MTGRRIHSGRDIHYYDNWKPGWRQILRKRLDKRFAIDEDRQWQKWLMDEEIKELEDIAKGS